MAKEQLDRYLSKLDTQQERIRGVVREILDLLMDRAVTHKDADMLMRLSQLQDILNDKEQDHAPEEKF